MTPLAAAAYPPPDTLQTAQPITPASTSHSRPNPRVVKLLHHRPKPCHHPDTLRGRMLRCGSLMQLSVRRLTPRMKKQRNRGVDPLTAMSDEEGIRFGNVARATVKDQIKANNPPEVGSTLRRLLAAGFDERNAIEHITAVLAAEIYDVMNEGREFDLKKYITNLRRLPDLPEDADA
jgi:hypothetical protein